MYIRTLVVLGRGGMYVCIYVCMYVYVEGDVGRYRL